MSYPKREKLQTVLVEADVSEISEPVISNWKTYLACAAAYLYILSMGMTISYTAPATVDMRKPGSRMQDVTDDDITWMGSLTMLGGIPANMLGGFFTHKYGRKAVLMLSSFIFTSSWLMIAYAPSVGWICAGRIISGFCTGLYVVAIPAYIAEIAPQDKRGLLSSGLPLFNNIGMFFIMCLGLTLRWTWLAISIVILTVCSACVMMFMPESPVWLIRESRLREAAIGLKFFRGKHSHYENEVQRIVEVLRNEQQNEPVTLKDFKNPTLYKPLGISLCLMFFFAASGSGPIMAYTYEIFQVTGDAIPPAVGACIFTFLQIIATSVCGVIIDKYGRRKIYITSGVLTSLMLICIGTFSYLMKHVDVDRNTFGYITLCSFAVYAFVFNFGIGPMPFIMTPEMVSVQYRSTVLSIATIAISLFAFLSNKSWDKLLLLIGDYGAYWTYGALTFLSAIFGYFVLPETKNMSFEEISKSFAK